MTTTTMQTKSSTRQLDSILEMRTGLPEAGAGFDVIHGRLDGVLDIHMPAPGVLYAKLTPQATESDSAVNSVCHILSNLKGITPHIVVDLRDAQAPREEVLGELNGLRKGPNTLILVSLSKGFERKLEDTKTASLFEVASSLEKALERIGTPSCYPGRAEIERLYGKLETRLFQSGGLFNPEESKPYVQAEPSLEGSVIEIHPRSGVQFGIVRAPSLPEGSQLERRFVEEVKQMAGSGSICLDMSQVNELGADAVGGLLRAGILCGERNGAMTLLSVQPQIAARLRIQRADRLMEISELTE